MAALRRRMKLIFTESRGLEAVGSGCTLIQIRRGSTWLARITGSGKRNF